MRISTKGFAEAVARLKQLGDVPQARQFRQTLVDALEPIREQAVANINSVTGRTALSITVSPGASAIYPSAYIKSDKRIATAPWRGRPFFYPAAVELGHGGKHPAPPHEFFRPAVLLQRAATRRIVREGIEQLMHPYMTTLSIGGEFS